MVYHRHHTKDKGDSGLGAVIADLLSKNIQVALLVSEHLPFDCIAISAENRLVRLSVKYRAKASRGCLDVRFISAWSDKKGTHRKAVDVSTFDATAVYCPDTGKCYYVRNSETNGAGFTLRLETSKNNQASGVRLAADYLDPQRLFE